VTKIKTNGQPYYNIGQLRVDYWNKLKIQTSELARCHKGSENEKTQTKCAAVTKRPEGGMFSHSRRKERLQNSKMPFQS
jgi:arginine decarboxylase